MKKPRPAVRHAASAKFSKRGLRGYFEYRDLGIRRASGGKVLAQFVYVLKGWVKMQYERGKPILMKAGSCFFQPPRIRHRELAHSRDLEMIEVVAPGDFQTYDA